MGEKFDKDQSTGEIVEAIGFGLGQVLEFDVRERRAHLGLRKRSQHHGGEKASSELG